MKKRIASLLMAVLMLVTMLPVTAMAEELAAADPAEEQIVSEEVTTEPTEETGETETPAEPEQPEQTGEETQPSEDAELPPEEPVEDEPVPLADDTDADTDTVTRIAWVQKLVAAFDMTVEDDNYPDNYYTDIDSTTAYYRDLMVAVEFGVIDLEAGLPFEPEEPATREFAAHTLNYCLGFQLDDSTYTYADTADVTYKDDVQVAVNRGWFALADGSFLPKQAMTTTEAEAMLADAAAVLEGTVVSEIYNSTYTFKTGVIEIPNGTDVQVTDGVVRITDCPKTLTNGCIFVVYLNGLPVAYVADTVTKEGNVTVVTATRAEDADAFEAFDAQGVVEADLTLVEALDGTELAYYVEELDQEFQTYAMAKAAASRIGGSKKAIQLTGKKEISLGSGVKLSLNVKIKNPTVSFRVNLEEAYVELSFDLLATYQVKGNFLPASCISDINDIKLIYWGVPGVGGFSVTYDVSLNGSITGVQECHVSSGIKASIGDGVSFPREFKTKSFSISVEATCQMGFSAKFGISELPVVKAYLYAGVGFMAKFKANTYEDDAAPKACAHFAAYVYARYGASGQVDFGLLYKNDFNFERSVYNETNSPVRIVHHYEDGKLVPQCTRGNVSSWFGKTSDWYTSGDSRYMSSGWSSGFGGSGYGKDGTPIVIYEYTTDEEGNATITKYNGSARGLVIPSALDGYTVVAIGNEAFRDNNNLRAVTIPDTVTNIGQLAFYWCKNLSDVTLSANLVRLGERAFSDCTSLTAITIPKTLESAGSSPFNNCTALSNITLEQGMTAIASNLFKNCSGLVSITIPDTVTSIGTETFRNCANLERIIIPDTVTNIGPLAFCGCKNLSDVTLSANLVRLGERAFSDCTSLTAITIPKTLESAGSSPFNNCTALSNVTLEQGMKTVTTYLFKNCSGLVSITIPDTVTSIRDEAFRSCSSLKNVEIPDSVTEIGFSAFRECTSLEKIVIPNTVTSMGNYVFCGCKKLSDVTLPNTQKSIREGTFKDCASLEKITLPETVDTIYRYAFDGCTLLKELPQSEALTTIDSSAFSNCSTLETLELSNSVTQLGASAFSNCDALTTVVIPDSVTSMGTNVFYDCDALTSVKLGSGITTIPVSTFEHCDVLESIVIPRRVTTIGNTAFKDCVKFTSITIPRSVTSISSNAFSYPAKMTIYGVAGTYAETFANDNSIKFVAEEVSATAVTLNTTELTISKGASATLFLTVTPEDFTDAVSWKSSNTSVATISDTGVVKAVGLGTATIKVVVGSKSASCKVTVQQPVTSISLNKTSLILEALGTYQLTATVIPSTAVDRRISWSSSAPDIASVDENGLVTAHKKGSATITASAMDGSGVTRTCTVTVSNTAYICATVADMESPHNYPDNCNDFWVYTIPGAEKLLVTFDARTNIEDGFDYLYAYDAEENQVGKYTGTELAGQTITIPGDTVRLKLVSDDSGNEWGFKVSSITPGMTGGAVSGNVTTGGNAADPVTIALKQDGSTVKTTTVTGGSYLVSGLTDGTYTLEASKPGCVSRSYTVAVKDGEVVSSLDIVLVARGNINGAAVNGDDVEITDVACLYHYLTANDRSQSSISDEAYFLSVADVNSDGAVDVYDLQLLYETVSGIA